MTDSNLNDQNIKVALSGQIESDTRIVFTYPAPYDPLMSAGETWLRGIFDPREARNFAEAKRVYTFWSTPDGNYYGLIVPSPNDTRNGRLMITIYVGQRIIRSGAALVSAFAALERMLIIDPASTDKEKMAQLLSGLELVPDRLGMKMSMGGRIGWREVPEARQLEKMLANCDQREYNSFRRVLFVLTIYGAPTNPMEYTKITAPIVPYVAPQPKPAAPVPPRRPIPAQPVKEPMSASKLIVSIIGVLVGLYILFAAICGFTAGVVPPFRSDKAEAAVTEEKNDSTVQAGKGELSPADAEAFDVAYLQANDQWNLADLKSEKYRQLASFIQAGQADQVAQQRWFDGVNVNGYWRQIEEKLAAYPDKMSEFGNAMGASCPGEVVNVADLASRFERITAPNPERPEAAPTPSSRPRHEQPKPAGDKKKKSDTATKREKKSDRPVKQAESKQNSESTKIGRTKPQDSKPNN